MNLEGKDKDNPLVVACVRSVVGTVEPFPFGVVLVHDAFHMRLMRGYVGAFFGGELRLSKYYYQGCHLILWGYVGASMDPTVILGKV